MYKGNNTISSVIKGSSNIAKILFNSVEVWRKGLLPDGYTRCEYLESTGTQYINTGIMGIVQKIETEFQVTKIASSQSHLFGVADSDYQNTLRFGITADNKWFFGSIATIGSTTITSFSADLLKHSLSVIVPNAILDEINIQGVGTPTLTKKPLFIFARSRQVAELFGYFKIYSFKIYQNDNLVRDYIPCLDNNNRPCMYDMVSKQTFYNQGTGEFLYAVAK